MNMNTMQNQLVVEHVATFRRLHEPLEFYHIPEISQRRKTTDVSFLIILGICIIATLSLMTYSFTKSDMRRFTHGYDNCGNVCGSKNSKIDDIPCSGEDMSDKPFLLSGTYECVNHCDAPFVSKFNRCYRSSQMQEDLGLLPYTVTVIGEESVGITVLCFVGLGLSILALILFRYFVKVFIWTMLFAAFACLVGITGVLWYLNAQDSTFLYTAIVFTIISVVYLLFLWLLAGRIKLIIRFFEEAANIIFAMPLLLLEPFLTYISNFVVFAIFVYTFLLMATSGNLQRTTKSYSYGYEHEYEFALETVTTVTMCISAIMAYWMSQFILACQQMVISGAVAAYYFTRDKLALVSPIYGSFYNLIRYHLGTAAFGSFTITVITILKVIIRAFANDNKCFQLIYICCLRPLEDLLRYLTSMAYIETAIHGQPLCRSGMRAVNLIVGNYLSALVMNSVANLAFFMAKFVVVAATVGIGFAMGLPGVLIFFGGFVGFVCVHCFFVVFEIAVDTIFLCYCEDQNINDGNVNPFYTNVDLYETIKKAQIMTMAIEAKKKKK